MAGGRAILPRIGGHVGLLQAIGIDADAESLYRRVLLSDRLPLDDHAAALGWAPQTASAARRALVAEQLVVVEAGPDGGDALVAVDPRGVIGRIVEREAHELDGRRQALDGVRAVVDELVADHRAGRRAGGRDVGAPAGVEFVPPDLESGAVEELLRTTTGLLRSMHLEVATGPAAAVEVYRLARSQIAQGRELRSVYPTSVLDHPAALDWVVNWGAIGERQRLGDSVPHEFVVFGREAVVAPPRWGSTAGGTVVIRLPLVVHAFTRVFDDAWSGGVALPGAAQGSDDASRLLTLLAAGLKDEAIARALGVGVRTVRRRVAETMDELGVRTRFQLGAAAERRQLTGMAPPPD